MERLQKLILLLFSLSLFNCQGQKSVLEKRPVFKVHKIENDMVIDGKMEEADWKKSEARTLDYFYQAATKNEHQKTVYRMLWDDENLYLFFECEDTHIVARETQRDGAPYFDDCAELFLIPAPKPLNVHIALEVSVTKIKNDVLFINNFDGDKNLAAKWYNPNYTVGVQIDGTVNDNTDTDTGWTMEFKIPFNVLWGLDRAYPIERGTKYMFLALRQDRNTLEGDKRSTTTIFPVENIELYDVHQPDMFGLLELVE
ncbi:carbohydrate-binding family 9-like protein [Seonamhaeicola sp.]|uniref:carbohydrate-binding family 9-like protein n=1 Tax=Seonamhaeicola sp. TaxID=1912245 RepID=UPI00262ABC31|nr:carbohydrate-binding family 9-like protein [Seonamhaeicola sp.]